MRYESEILYDLMKRDGLLNPSQDNLPYESELKEKYVNEVEGAYPKLQDYRAEWLNYNKCEYIPADFPTESQTNQTSGTFQNVIPFAYDVATLKGQTLVNIVNNDNWNQGGTDLFAQNISIKKGQIYTVIGKTQRSDVADVENTPAFRICAGTNSGGTSLFFIQNSAVAFKRTFTNNENDTIHLRFYNQKTNYKKLMIIEGDYTSVDIPYFEGMQSVQMPVLTTTGKNLFNYDSLILNKYQNNETYDYSIGNNGQHAIYKLDVKANTTYTLSMSKNGVFYDINNQPISWFPTTNPVTTPNNCKYMIINFTEYATNDYTKFQIEQGTQATTYEPYKSNILTVNDDVTLRGVGDVKDTLDLTTGEVVQNFGEIILNGNESYYSYANTSKQVDTVAFKIKITGHAHSWYTGIGLCNKFPFVNGEFMYLEDKECVTTDQNNIIIRINKTKASTLDEFKTWLSNNNIKVVYPLTEKSVKTVDLSCVNEDNVECDLVPIMDTMHYQTSSDTILPLADLTVCVEATTQNLASFIHLEGVEHDE